MNSLIFLTEKHDGSIKARACTNRSIQRDHITKQEAMSPKVKTDGQLTTCVIDAIKGQNVITLNISNAFIKK